MMLARSWIGTIEGLDVYVLVPPDLESVDLQRVLEQAPAAEQGRERGVHRGRSLVSRGDIKHIHEPITGITGLTQNAEFLQCASASLGPNPTHGSTGYIHRRRKGPNTAAPSAGAWSSCAMTASWQPQFESTKLAAPM